MPRRTKEELRLARADKWLDGLVQSNKYLREAKFYKNNYWSWAAWDSWAAQGKAGSCGCGIGHYNGTLANTRAKTRKGGREDSCKQVSSHFCSNCIDKIEEKINHKFRKH